MDTAELLVTIGGIVLIILTLWFFLGRRTQPPPPGLYACPMHPWITSGQPAATCSQCGMALVRQENRGGR
jgi:hypothetical protein